MNQLRLSRRYFLKSLAVGTVGVLAACTPGAPAPAPAGAGEAAAPAGERTTVRLLTTHGATMAPFISVSLENFAAEHPEIQVDHEDLTEGYYDRLNIMLASETLPDVVNLRSFDMFDWYRLGNLHSVSPFLDADPNLEPGDLVEAILRSCYYDGDYWGLPYDASVVIVYYNQDMFDAAGIEYPADTWNWNDMLEIANNLTIAEEQVWGFARFPAITNWMAEPWYLANGARMISDDRSEWGLVGAEAEEALQFVIDLANRHQVAPPPEGQTDLNLFVIGKGAMYVSGQWEIPGNRDAIRDFEWDIAAFPAGPAGHHPITHGGTYIMYANTRVPDAAWQIQKWICAEPDWQASVYGASGYSVPSLLSVAEEAWMAPVVNEGKPPANAQVVLSELDAAVPGSLWPNYQRIASIMSEEMEQVLLGEVTVAEGLENLKVRADQVIQEALQQAG